MVQGRLGAERDREADGLTAPAKRRLRVGAVIIEDDKLALIERRREGRTYYVFPGGGVEDGEDLATALRRECMEELGVEVTPGKHLATILFGVHSHQEYLRASITGGAFGTGTGPEYGSYPPERGSYHPVWIALRELSKVDVRPRSLAEALARDDAVFPLSIVE